MSDDLVTETCADLTEDDAVTRARTAEPVESWPITSDANYLRSDGRHVLDILNGVRPVFNVVAPRRWGKTSFLERVKRHAEARRRRVVLAAFNTGVDVVVAELATFFETEARVDAVGAAVRALKARDPERPIVLLDEGAGQIEARDEHGHAMRSLLAQLAAAARKGLITLCHAEIPQFFARCEEQGDDLNRPSELVVQTPILLGPVEDGVRQAFLGPIVEAGYPDLVRAIGSIPGEIQAIRCQFSRTRQVNDDAEFLLGGFRASWTNVLRTVVQNLDADERAVLWRACQTEPLSANALSPSGSVVQLRLQDWGLLQSIPGKKVIASSTATGDLLKGLVKAPPEEVFARVFKEGAVELPKPDSPLPEATFEDGFIIHQIADLHFGQFSERIGEKWLGEYYIDHLRLMKPTKRPHVIIICGDLTSFAAESEFVDAARFIQQLKGSAGPNGSALLQPFYDSSVADCEKQIIVVPGNHDVTWREQREDGEAAIRPFQRFCDIAQVLTPLSPCPAVHFAPVSVTVMACNSARGLSL